MPINNYRITVRKGEDRTRLAQLRHSTIAEPLIVAADVSTIKVRVIAGIGEGPTEVIEDRQIAPAPGLLNIADVIKDTPLTGPGWKGHAAGANFIYLFKWDDLIGDKYDGLRVYREEYEIDCRAAGFSRELLVYDVRLQSTLGPIST